MSALSVSRPHGPSTSLSLMLDLSKTQVAIGPTRLPPSLGRPPVAAYLYKEGLPSPQTHSTLKV